MLTRTCFHFSPSQYYQHSTFGCFTRILYNMKFFKLKLHFKVSFTHCKNDIVKFSTGNELFIKEDNGAKLIRGAITLA